MNDLQLANRIILKDFHLDPGKFPDPADRDELRNRVRAVVSELLDQDMEKLLLILYRIDVNEERVKAVLSGSMPGSVATDLADLIIERELQKVETRLKYQ